MERSFSSTQQQQLESAPLTREARATSGLDIHPIVVYIVYVITITDGHWTSAKRELCDSAARSCCLNHR